MTVYLLYNSFHSGEYKFNCKEYDKNGAETDETAVDFVVQEMTAFAHGNSHKEIPNDIGHDVSEIEKYNPQKSGLTRIQNQIQSNGCPPDGPVGVGEAHQNTSPDEEMMFSSFFNIQGKC